MVALNENLCDKAFQERTGAVMGLFHSELIELGPTGHLCYAEPKEGETGAGACPASGPQGGRGALPASG